MNARIFGEGVGRQDEVAKPNASLAVGQTDQQVHREVPVVIPEVHLVGRERSLDGVVLIDVNPNALVDVLDNLRGGEGRHDMTGVENSLVVVFVFGLGFRNEGGVVEGDGLGFNESGQNGGLGENFGVVVDRFAEEVSWVVGLLEAIDGGTEVGSHY